MQLTQAEGQLARDQAQLKNAKVNLERYQRPGRARTHRQAAARHPGGRWSASSRARSRSTRAPIDNAKLQLTYCRITAPISGRVGLRLVDAGNIVHATDANGLVVITQLQPIAVIFTIPEDSLPPVLTKLRAGEQLPVDAYDRAGKTQARRPDTLLTVDNQIDPTTGTARLKAVFPNEDNALFPEPVRQRAPAARRAARTRSSSRRPRSSAARRARSSTS